MYGSQPENGGTAADRPDCLGLLRITAMCAQAQAQLPAFPLLNVSTGLHGGAATLTLNTDILLLHFQI